MEIGAIIDILRSHPETAALKPGDELTVKVLEIFDDRRALVDLGRFRAMAGITFPVAAGEELRVRVQETRRQLRLQLISSPGDPLAEAGRTDGPVRAAALESLKDFFDGTAGRELAMDRREIGALAKAAAELLAEIRAGQEQMAKPAAAESFQTVHFALPMPEGTCRAGLKIAYRRRSAAGTAAGHRAAILLQLDRMGAVRADLTLLNSGLSLSIFVSDAGFKDEVRRHVNEVREALAPFFQHVAVQVSVSPRKIDRFESEEWRPGGEGQVDVRV